MAGRKIWFTYRALEYQMSTTGGIPAGVAGKMANSIRGLRITIHKVGGELTAATVKDPWGNMIGLIYNPDFGLECGSLRASAAALARSFRRARG